MSDFDMVQMVKPKNIKALGVLGYLIVLNNQVHSYEMKALEAYLKSIEVDIVDTCLDAIIRGVDESISYATSYEALSNMFSVYDDVTQQVQEDREKVHRIMNKDKQTVEKLLNIRRDLMDIQRSIF